MVRARARPATREAPRCRYRMSAMRSPRIQRSEGTPRRFARRRTRGVKGWIPPAMASCHPSISPASTRPMRGRSSGARAQREGTLVYQGKGTISKRAGSSPYGASSSAARDAGAEADPVELARRKLLHEADDDLVGRVAPAVRVDDLIEDEAETLMPSQHIPLGGAARGNSRRSLGSMSASCS
jgi:hypothetical protein